MIYNRPITKLRKSRFGFTLIEILIAITVSGIILSIGVAQYNEFSKNQLVKSAALNFKNNLRDTQAKATSGLKPACTGNHTLAGYQIAFNADAKTYTAQAQCSGGPNTSPVTTYTLPSGLQFYPLPQNITFDVLNGGTNLTSPQTIAIGNTDHTKCFGLSVTATGEITDLGAVACPASLVAKLNSGSDSSCDEVCPQTPNPAGDCVYITTNQSDPNSTGMYYTNFLPGCGQVSGDCGSPMWGDNSIMCSGHSTNWTYCVCKPLN